MEIFGLIQRIRSALRGNDKQPDPKRYIETEVVESSQVRTLRVPVYSLFDVGPLNCSRYVRLAAELMFNKRFSATSAWDRRYDDKIAISSDEVEQSPLLKRLAEGGRLKPGMVLGVYNPESHYSDKIDKVGNRARYTHNLLYIGENRDGKLLFANQFIDKTLVVDEAWLKERGLEPVEFLDSSK